MKLCGALDAVSNLTTSNKTHFLGIEKMMYFVLPKKGVHTVLFLPPYSPRHAKRGKRARAPGFNLMKKDVFIPLLVFLWMTSLNHTEII